MISLNVRKMAVALGMMLCDMASAQELPLDNELHRGVLDNGMTYYIRHNESPRQHVSFYIAQRVGSVQDEVKRMMQQMAEGCDASLLQNAQAMLRSGFEQSLQQDNASWTSFARTYMIYGIDYVAEYYEALARTTVQDLASHACHLLSQGHCYHTVARPGK